MISLLSNPIRPYDWGSRTAIAELLGEPSPAAGPQAELWMGAHPGDPSLLPDGTALDAHIAADPVTTLGQRCIDVLGPRLPFLAKVLAAAKPLSLQVHPTLAQARAGYAAEQVTGRPADDPARNYKDDNHKPELICALTPFRGLAGFRPVEQSARLIESLGVPELSRLTADLADSDGVRRIVGDLLRLDPAGRAPLVESVVAACAQDGEFPAERACAVGLAQTYPGDPGIIVALLLNLVSMRPGEALFLPAGMPHAYIDGVGVEVMANSDNVLRGGLTSKHIDVPELLSILDPEPAPAAVQEGAAQPGGEWAYETPAREFALSRVRGGVTLASEGPQIVVTTEGSLTLSATGLAVDLPQGRAAFLPAALGSVEVAGSGTAYRVTTNVDAPGVA